MRKLSFFDKIFFFLNILAALVLAISLLIPYVPTKLLSSLSIVSLVVPFTVIVNLIFVFYWLLKRKRNFLLSGFLLLLWYIMLGPFYQFSSNENRMDVDSDKSLSLMTFNARGFNELKQLNSNNIENQIYDFVTKKNPDIVCFQETYYAMKRNNALNQYDYKFVDFIYGKYHGKVIQSVYSKFPILKIDSIPFPNSSNNAIYVDVLYQKDTIRIYNLHLQSFRIVPGLRTVQNQESAKLLKKSQSVMLKQYEQASLIREDMNSVNYNKIVVGDFNNTQYSNVYQVIKGEMKDSYLEKGKGFGRTYDLLKFPLRIDYILVDPEFEVLSHQNFDVRLSDHYPIMATLRLKSHQ
ncbi:MAG: endonuclease/exonuclease/phosphatase family protein [Flagellimonas sp.]